MTKLSNIRTLGKYRNIETGEVAAIRKGRNKQRGTDVLFYTKKGRGRLFVSDRQFYSDKIWVDVDKDVKDEVKKYNI